jgi:hypothetical protein
LHGQVAIGQSTGGVIWMGCLKIIALLINKVLIALKENISMTDIEIKKSKATNENEIELC